MITTLNRFFSYRAYSITSLLPKAKIDVIKWVASFLRVVLLQVMNDKIC